jgi:hypothetical protein
VLLFRNELLHHAQCRQVEPEAGVLPAGLDAEEDRPRYVLGLLEVDEGLVRLALDGPLAQAAEDVVGCRPVGVAVVEAEDRDEVTAEDEVLLVIDLLQDLIAGELSTGVTDRPRTRQQRP